MILTISQDIPTKPIDVNIESKGFARKKPVSFDTTDQHDTAEKEPWKATKKHDVQQQPSDHSSQCHFLTLMIERL